MWEDRFAAADGYLFGTAPSGVLADNPWIARPGGSALCVADGEGRNAAWLAGQGMQVTSFDLSPTAVGRARDLAAERGLRIDAHVSGWEDWDWSRRFDLVCAIFIQFTGPEDRKRHFADLARATRPGGRLLVHGYTPEQVGRGTGGPPDRANMYTEEILRQGFDGWRIERLARYERHQTSGSGHVGDAALIDLVARKPE
ncbi:MAG: Methyltransferase domain [Rhodobacteraceae bacterium HLUCCA08]|nr:MAG: Methyltransferase domain [Rhodobacteraceae bacterium HLUCCA08]